MSRVLNCIQMLRDVSYSSSLRKLLYFRGHNWHLFNQTNEKLKARKEEEEEKNERENFVSVGCVPIQHLPLIIVLFSSLLRH